MLIIYSEKEPELEFFSSPSVLPTPTLLNVPYNAPFRPLVDLWWWSTLILKNRFLNSSGRNFR